MSGDADAQDNLGRMYAFGVEVPQDYVEAVKWFSRAAEQGHVNAQFNLGVAYAEGRGVPQDEVEAVKWAHVVQRGCFSVDRGTTRSSR